MVPAVPVLMAFPFKMKVFTIEIQRFHKNIFEITPGGATTMSIATRVHAAIRQWRTAFIVSSSMLMHCVMAWGQTTSNPNILIVPFGIWQVCESTWGAQTPACVGFKPGSEQFLLLIKASRPETMEYLYTIVATMLDGSKRAVSGQLKRKANSAGYSSTNLYFGGVAVSFETTVEEAVISAVQTGTGTFQP